MEGRAIRRARNETRIMVCGAWSVGCFSVILVGAWSDLVLVVLFCEFVSLEKECKCRARVNKFEAKDVGRIWPMAK